ncbi:MAG: bifunctional DNA primase/polymerase [Notoacmeibacter sp.]|nr:bifunctional DNA primase/polymerase [Notoacmeibacter sp.]
MNIESYAGVRAVLNDKGYPALPVLPGEKVPGEYVGGRWRRMMRWQHFCETPPPPTAHLLWDNMPGAGTCVPLGGACFTNTMWHGASQLVAVDLDHDVQGIHADILRAIPESPCAKRGAKGQTLFYMAPASLPGRNFRVDTDDGSVGVLDFLASGKQTVIPPTIHPGTGEPYVWLGTPLWEIHPAHLPELDADVVDRLARILRAVGYKPSLERATGRVDARSSSYRAINDAALVSLRTWVPALGIPVRRSGDGYRARAVWRGGDDFNIGIHRNGIRDFARDKAMTPLDLIMTARSCNLRLAKEFVLQHAN